VHASQILYEDNHLLVINKPADWIVQGASPDQRSLLESARMYIKSKYHKPGNVYLGVVSRLDAPVTGAVPFARTSKCAARLAEQFRNQAVGKDYWARTASDPGIPSDSLFAWAELSVDPTNHRSQASDTLSIGSDRVSDTWGHSLWRSREFSTGHRLALPPFGIRSSDAAGSGEDYCRGSDLLAESISIGGEFLTTEGGCPAARGVLKRRVTEDRGINPCWDTGLRLVFHS
jgi:hypothetical protein